MRRSVKLITRAIEELREKIKKWEAQFEECELQTDYEFLLNAIENGYLEIESLQTDLKKIVQ